MARAEFHGSHRSLLPLRIVDVRTFDWLGILFVGGWLIAVAAFALVGHDQEGELVSLTDGAFDLREDTVWMVVYHAGEEVGILREDRTRLVDGWLIENQGIAELSFGADPHVFQFSSRVTLRDDLALRSATASIDAFGRTLEMFGQYSSSDDAPSFNVNLTLDDATEQFSASLEERPRIAPHAIPQILAQHDPQPGDRFIQDYFDPMTLTPSTIELTYEGQRHIENIDGDYPDAHHFRQSAGSLDTQIYVDEWGMPIQQNLPMQVALARLPEALGPGQFADFQERFEDRGADAPPFVDAIDAGDLLAIAARFGSGDLDRLQPDDLQDFADDDDLLALADDDASEPAGDPDTTDEPRRVTLDPLPDRDLHLLSPRQHIAFQSSTSARIEVGHPSPLWHTGHAPTPTTADTHWPDLDDAPDWFVDLVDHLPDDLQDLNALQSSWPDTCPDWGQAPALKPSNSPPTLDDVEPSEQHECLFSMAQSWLHHDLSPHFVHGYRLDAHGEPIPHIWIALYDGRQYLADIDPLAGPVGRDHIQLWIDDRFELHALDALADLQNVLQISD